ncbi:MAG: hypothetical protein KatS3mg108_1617 [Isosphaeraceae bacterium]|jgi:membrane-bound serine protease (ClpP class)|nr:MAG: hypothetical protein KatS3mg108_1617 [Isosphaeraceae bacterium]
MGFELVWPTLCLLGSLLLVLAEAFIPSGGLIGILAVGLLLVSLYLAFTTTAYGWLFLIAVGVLLPATVMLAVSLWPHTPIARYLFLPPPTTEETTPGPSAWPLSHLVGQIGRTVTPLRPTGIVLFEGRRHEAISEGIPIEANTLVRALEIRGGRLIVRVAEVPEWDDTPQTSN